MGRPLNEKSDHVLANMEQLGAETVRDLISSGRWPANYDALAREWLHQKDLEEGNRKEAPGEAQTRSDTKERQHKDADGEAQMPLAQRSNEVAYSAREAAEGANVTARNAKNIAFAAASLVEQSASTAKTAKRIAIAALVAALIAIAIPIATLFIRWPPALQTLLYIMWQKRP